MTKLIIAIDTNNLKTLKHIVDSTYDFNICYKIGMETFYSLGVSALDYITKKNKDIFLDLKLHDIPNTVANALSSLMKYNISIINIHSLGGKKMMIAAKKSIQKQCEKLNRKAPKLIAVTHLTSMSNEDLSDIGIKIDINKNIMNLAKLSKDCGLDGVVCSAHESAQIKDLFNLICITPGIRFKDDKLHDQKRVMTPKEAMNNQSDYIVMGRSITLKNIRETTIQALKEINEY